MHFLPHQWKIIGKSPRESSNSASRSGQCSHLGVEPEETKNGPPHPERDRLVRPAIVKLKEQKRLRIWNLTVQNTQHQVIIPEEISKNIILIHFKNTV